MPDPSFIDPTQIAGLPQPQAQQPPMMPPAQPAPAGGGGLLDVLGKVLTHPATQAALAGYFQAISAPKHTSALGRFGQGGLSGLQAFNQAQQSQEQLPYERALAQEAQARVPLMQQQATQAGLQSQQLRRELAPIPSEVIARLDAYKATAQDPQERGYIDMLEAQATNGLITPQDLDKAIQSFDENKRMMELYKGQAALQQAQMMPWVMSQFGFPGAPGGTPGGMVSPATPAAAPAGGTEPGVAFKTTLPGKGEVTAVQDTDGKTYYLEGGKWIPMP